MCSYARGVAGLWQVIRAARTIGAIGDLGRPGPPDPVADQPTVSTWVLLAVDIVGAAALVLVAAVAQRTALRVAVVVAIVLFLADALTKGRRLSRIHRRRRELRARYR